MTTPIPECGYYGEDGYVRSPFEVKKTVDDGIGRVADAAIRVAQAEGRNVIVRKLAALRMHDATINLDITTDGAEDACSAWNRDNKYVDHLVREELGALGIPSATSAKPIESEGNNG